jgi:hypothetical protein
MLFLLSSISLAELMTEGRDHQRYLVVQSQHYFEKCGCRSMNCGNNVVFHSPYYLLGVDWNCSLPQSTRGKVAFNCLTIVSIAFSVLVDSQSDLWMFAKLET